MNELSLALPLKPYETATSYVSRLTRHAGLASPHDFCTDMGMHWPSVVRGDADQLDRLAHIGDVSARKLRHWSIRSSGRLRFRVCGEDVINKTMTRSRLRICPCCILEDIAADGPHGVYRRNYWQFISIRTCEKHNIALIELPPQKHTIENYDVVGQVAVYRDRIDSAAHGAERAVFTEFEAYLKARLKKEANLPFLDGFKLHIATKLCELLGAVFLFDRTPNLRELTDRQMHQAGAAGYARVRGGEAALLDALRELREDCDPEISRHRADLGVLYDWLQRTPENADINSVKMIVRDYIFATYPINAGQKVLGAPCPETQNFTSRSGSREFGYSRRLIYRLAQQARLATYDRMAGTFQLKSTIPKARMATLVARSEEFIGYKDARALLGVALTDLIRLERIGLIQRHHNKVESTRPWLSAEVRDLRASLIANTLRQPSPGQLLLPIRQASNTKRRRFEMIIAMIAAGHLKRSVWQNPDDGIHAMQIDQSALFAAIASWPPFRVA